MSDDETRGVQKPRYGSDLEQISDGFTQAHMLLMLRQAQHERVFPKARGLSVRPEPVEACPELVEGGEQVG